MFRVPADMNEENLRHIAWMLDYYDGFARRVIAKFPDLDWSAFPFDIDGADHRETQEMLIFWADELEP
jgi:hypothetical protein